MKLSFVIADFIIVQIFGWFSADAACASRRNRSSARGSRGNVVREEFQGDEAAQPGVLGLIDDAHAASAELGNDAVVRDRPPYHERKPWTDGCLMIGCSGLCGQFTKKSD